MRIGVNARILDYLSGGPTEYLRGLTRALLDLRSGHELVVFYTGSEHAGTFPDATEVVLPIRNRLGFDWLALPRALRRHRCDVAFFPCSNMPAGIPCPSVVAMHDLGYFHPGPRMYKAGDTLYMRWSIRYAARRARRLLAMSAFTAQELAQWLGVRSETVAITHEACDTMYKAVPSPRAVAAFRRDNGLERDYILFSGNISPRKNLCTLLAAFARVRESIPCDLVVTGGLSWNEDFATRLREAGLASRVRRLGHVPRESMPLLYRGARILAYPSVFEGFGLPVLEGQACGVPVVCSDATALPEVAGDGALLVAPLAVDAWAEALVRVATDQDLREALVRRGHANEARFTWRATAEKTLAALEAAAAGPGSR